jgi:glycosyltransferase involved in cell wall biosynthesis
MITLIATVLNEGDNIDGLMESIASQSRLPDEVVIVDGGSTDDTVARIEHYSNRLPLRVVVEPGCNISRGRNRALAEARGDIIAVTDAGVRLVPCWLEAITELLCQDPAVMVVGGFFRADPQTTFEIAMGATVLPLEDEIDSRTFLPSSRSLAFRRRLLEQVGGYPEWLDYCEDLVFDMRLQAVASPFTFEPAAVAYFRPRQSLKAFFVQYYRYARGDGKADLWRKRHLVRYVTYLVLVPAIFLLGWHFHPALWLLVVAGAVVYLRQPYRRLFRLMTGRWDDWLYVIALVPVIRVVGDIAKMIGYPVGWLWRIRNHPPDWREAS